MAADENPLRNFFYGDHSRPLYKWDHYFDIYHRHFAGYRDRPIRMLEIGVYKGGSLDMWRQYFHPESLIVGIDRNHDCKKIEAGNIKVRIGNQKDTGFLNRLVDEFGEFDIVVDDGGHVPRDQITTFRNLYPQISATGVYLVEDTHTSLWPTYLKQGGGTSFMAFCAQKTLELMQWTGQEHLAQRFHLPREERGQPAPATEFCRSTKCIAFYDSVVVFEKGPRPEPFTAER